MFKFLILFYTLIFCTTSVQAKVIAQAGSIKITDTEFKKSYAKALENSMALDRPPTKKEHLEDMLRYRIGLAEAREKKIAKNPIVRKAIDLQIYKGLLELNLAKSVEKIIVTDQMMKDYYQKNPTMRSSHIMISYPIEATKAQIADAKKRADNIYNDIITKKKKWSVNVRMYSDDNSTKKIRGDIGYQSAESVQPRYYRALKALKMGEISKPVQSIYGFHIIKKTGQRSYARANKDALKIATFNKKRYQVFDKYFEGLKKKYKAAVIDPNFQ